MSKAQGFGTGKSLTAVWVDSTVARHLRKHVQALGRQESVTLLLIGRRNQHGFVMCRNSVLIDRGRGLRSEVAVLALEVKSGDAIFALFALEHDAALDLFGCVTSRKFH